MEYIILGIVLFIFILLTALYWSYNNKEISLRKKASAQENNIMAIHTKMLQVIQQSAGVAVEYADRFNEIYTNIMNGRYGNQGMDDGSLMRFIQENNPEFNTSVYNELQVQIEALRGEFAENQKIMLDIVREHNTLCEQFPYKFFILNKTPITYELIRSSDTNDIMTNRIDNNTNLF